MYYIVVETSSTPTLRQTVDTESFLAIVLIFSNRELLTL